MTHVCLVNGKKLSQGFTNTLAAVVVDISFPDKLIPLYFGIDIASY